MFYDILERKNRFLRYKNKKLKKSKKWDFSKGVSPGFWPKLAIFPIFYFKEYRPGKCILRYSRTKKPLSKISKQAVEKVEKVRFFRKRYSMILAKNRPFLPLFVLGNIGQENVFYDILEPKNRFLRYNNKKLKKSKKWDFS